MSVDFDDMVRFTLLNTSVDLAQEKYSLKILSYKISEMSKIPKDPLFLGDFKP